MTIELDLSGSFLTVLPPGVVPLAPFAAGKGHIAYVSQLGAPE